MKNPGATTIVVLQITATQDWWQALGLPDPGDWKKAPFQNTTAQVVYTKVVTTTQTDPMLALDDVAHLLGISVRAARERRQQKTLPEPAEYVGRTEPRKPLWRLSQFQ